MERDKRGHWQKGQSGNPRGRPKKEREVLYYKLLQTQVSAADWIEIINKAVSQAKKGDAVARKWLADYIIGPPVERKEITGADGNNIVLTVLYDGK